MPLTLGDGPWPRPTSPVSPHHTPRPLHAPVPLTFLQLLHHRTPLAFVQWGLSSRNAPYLPSPNSVSGRVSHKCQIFEGLLLHAQFALPCSTVWFDQCLSPHLDLKLLRKGTVSILLIIESPGTKTVPGTKQMVTQSFFDGTKELHFK